MAIDTGQTVPEILAQPPGVSGRNPSELLIAAAAVAPTRSLVISMRCRVKTNIPNSTAFSNC
jgi:hypothetical protein